MKNKSSKHGSLFIVIAVLLIVSAVGLAHVSIDQSQFQANFPPQSESNLVPEQTIRGTFFNPEIYNATGVPFGNAWLLWYQLPLVREKAREEMRVLRQIADVNTIVLNPHANRNLSWPVPTDNELDKLVNVINDANAEGLKVILQTGHPCIVPNSVVPTGYSKVHVGGHHTGEIVNGAQLYWDVAYCDDNNIELAEGWWDAIITRLNNDVIDQNGLLEIEHSGIP